MELITEIVIIVSCLLLSGFFSGSETALMRLRLHEVERDLESSRGLAVIAARDLISNTSRLLITILLGNNVVNILGSAVASALAIQLLGPERGIVVARTRAPWAGAPSSHTIVPLIDAPRSIRITSPSRRSWIR